MSQANTNESDLLKRSLRMIAMLVGACVLFVGVVSLGAVLFTSKVFTSPASADLKKPADSDSPANKKPLSI